jgi:hypothetical protein
LSFILKFYNSLLQLFLFNVIFFNLLSRCSVRRLHTTGWRLGVSGGIPALPFKSALPAAVAPNRSLEAGHYPSFRVFHPDGLSFPNH